VEAPSYQSGNRWKPIPINQATSGSPFLSIRQLVEAHSYQSGNRWKPIPINQATGGKAHSYQSSEYGHPIQRGRSSPYPSTVSQELRMDEEVTKAEPTCRS
jgi:hypothetical protein